MDAKKDLFIDNNIAKNFSNPLDPEYKKLIRWLQKYDPDHKADNAALVVSNKLMGEYIATTGNSKSLTNIVIIIDRLTREGRLNKISNSEIKEFKRLYFRKKVVRGLTCNSKDRDHIPVILLSIRKYALSLDEPFIHDLLHFPGYIVIICKRPQDLPYQD